MEFTAQTPCAQCGATVTAFVPDLHDYVCGACGHYPAKIYDIMPDEADALCERMRISRELLARAHASRNWDLVHQADSVLRAM